MKQKLFKKILRTITLIIICAFIATIVFGGVTLKNYFLRTQLEDVSGSASRIVSKLDNNISKYDENIKKDILDSSVVLFISKDKEEKVRINGKNIDEKHLNINDEQLYKAIENFENIVLSGNSIKGITQLNKVKGDSLIVGEPIKIEDEVKGALIYIKFPMDLSKVLFGFYIVLIISMSIALILILAPIYIYIDKIFKPLDDMNKAAMTMAKGDFSIRIDESSDDEIGEVAKSINYLAKRLQKNDKEAKILEQTRRDYVANVSHELRTPVTAIRAVSEMLEDNLIKDEKEKQKYYKQILRESIRLEILIKDMLDLSRLQSGNVHIEKCKISLDSILDEIVDEFIIIADDMDVNFIAPYNVGELPYVYTNKDRITQVLIILLDNAIKYTPAEGRVCLEVAIKDLYVEIIITDTGVGISEEDIPLVFERFYKADKSHSSNGTGIGLSIAQEIIKHLGESIRVESELGKGSKFVLTIHYN